jgi:WD40 repeat protein
MTTGRAWRARSVITALVAAGMVSAAIGVSSRRAQRARPVGGGQRSAEVVEDRADGRATGYTRRHALVVGLDRYRAAGGPFADLHGAGYDAEEVAAVLASRYGFEDVELLVDSPPRARPAGVDVVLVETPASVTAPRLADRLDALRGRVGPGDALVFYYAGHGHRRGARGYLVPAGGRPDDPGTMLDLADIAAGLRRCNAHHTLMVLDCCFSGVVLEPGSGVEAAVRAAGPLDDRLLGVAERDNVDRVLNRRAFQVITAGTAREPVGDVAQISQRYAEEGRAEPEYLGHSPFTAVLLQALRGLTGLPDGRQLASDLGYYMGATLVSGERVAARQVPRYGSLGGGDGDHLLDPAHKPVLNPRLIAPLYLTGEPYAQLRESACRALEVSIKNATGNVKRELTGGAVPHLTRLLRDRQPGPQLAAAEVLADLAVASRGETVPEFAVAVGPLTDLLKDPAQGQAPRRQAARAIGQLGEYVLPPGEPVLVFARYVSELERAWEVDRVGLMKRLEIREEYFQLPEGLQEGLDPIRVPEQLAPDASPAQSIEHHEKRRQRLDKLSTQAVGVYEQRHELGRTQLERAQKLWEQKDVLAAKMIAAEVIGYTGWGRGERERPFRQRHQPLLFPGSRDWFTAGELIRRSPLIRPVWRNPAMKHHPGRVNSLAFTPDGKTIASGDENFLKFWDTHTGDLVKAIKGPGRDFHRVAYSRDGTLLAFARKGRLFILNAADAGMVEQIQQERYDFNSLTFSPGGNTLAWGNQNGEVSLYKIRTGEQPQALRGHDGAVSALAFSRDGKWLVTGGKEPHRILYSVEIAPGLDKPVKEQSSIENPKDYTVRLWDLEKWQLHRTLTGHDGDVTSVDFSPDGTIFVSASKDNTVRLWGVPDGEAKGVLKGHKHGVNDVAFSPDGQVLASGSDDETVRLWNGNTGEPVEVFRGHESPVICVAFSPDGKILASGSGTDSGGEAMLRLWDATTHRPLSEPGWHSLDITKIAFSPDGRRLALAESPETYDERGGLVRLLDVVTMKTVAVLKGHSSVIAGLAFSPDGKTLASCCLQDQMVRLWDAVDGADRGILEGHVPGAGCVAFSPDETVIATGSEDGKVHLWDRSTGAPLHVLEGHKGHVETLAFSPDGILLASGGWDGLRLWDMRTRKPYGTTFRYDAKVTGLAFNPDGTTLTIGGNDRGFLILDVRKGGAQTFRPSVSGDVRDVEYNPDGRTLALIVTRGPDSQGEDALILWDVEKAETSAVLPGRGWNVCKALSPDGRFLAYAGRLGHLRFWDVGNGSSIVAPGDERDSVRALAYSPDGTVLASTWDYDKICFRDTVSGRRLAVLSGHRGSITSLAFSGDGSMLASCGADRTVRLWRATGEPLRILRGHGATVQCVAFSPDGTSVASASEDKNVRIWSIADGATVKTLPHVAAVKGVAYSPDGKTIATACARSGLVLQREETVQLWDAASGMRSDGFKEHSWDVNGVAFSPDGSLLASWGEDATVRLWAVAAKEPRGILRGEAGSVAAVAFSPDGKLLASVGGGSESNWFNRKSVRIWDCRDFVQYAALEGHAKPVDAIAFSPDSRRLATGSRDKTLRLWDVPSTGRDYAAYEEWEWAELSDGRVSWNLITSENLYKSKAFPPTNVAGDHTWVAGLAGSGTAIEQALFSRHLAVGSLNAASLLALRAGKAERPGALSALAIALRRNERAQPLQVARVCSRLIVAEPGLAGVRLTRGLALARLGRADDAMQDLLASSGGAKGGPDLYDLARGFSLCAAGDTPADAKNGDAARVVDALERASRLGSVSLAKLLGDQDYDRVRDSVQFKTLLEKLGGKSGPFNDRSAREH